MPDDTSRVIRDIVSDILEMPPEALQPQSTVRQVTAADSVMLLEILVALERRFRVDIHEEEAAGVTTLQDLTELVQRKLNAR